MKALTAIHYTAVLYTTQFSCFRLASSLISSLVVLGQQAAVTSLNSDTLHSCAIHHTVLLF